MMRGGVGGMWGEYGQRRGQGTGLGSRGGKAEPVITGEVGGHWRRNIPERAFAQEAGGSSAYPPVQPQSEGVTS